MNFIKNTLDGNHDEITHKQFRRFSKGIFEKRAMFDIKISKTNCSIKTTFEYLDGILLYAGEHFNGDVEISGTIIGSSDLLGKASKFGLEGERKSAMGVKKLELIPAKIEFSKLKDMVDEFKEEFLLLSLKSDGFELISKESLPKPGKEKREDGKDKIDFCKIKTNDTGLAKELLFDFNGNFNHAIGEHTFIIEDFELPKEHEKDPAKARLYAKRKGKLIRILNIDGKIEEKNYNFSA